MVALAPEVGLGADIHAGIEVGDVGGCAWREQVGRWEGGGEGDGGGGEEGEDGGEGGHCVVVF